jgi:hypothetical protein
MLEQPTIKSIIVTQGDVSDELDYFVNTYVLSHRGMGLTACEPSLVELDGGIQAIRFKLDSTFVDSVSNEIKGYGQLGSDIGFVGEVLVSYDETNQDNMEVLFISSQEEIDFKIQEILANPDAYPSFIRPKGKY